MGFHLLINFPLHYETLKLHFIQRIKHIWDKVRRTGWYTSKKTFKVCKKIFSF